MKKQLLLAYPTLRGFALLNIIFLWFQIANAQWTTNGPYGGIIECLEVNGSNLYAGTGVGGIFLSTNNGAEWAPINNGLGRNSDVRSMAFGDSDIYAACYGYGVFKSSDNGANWAFLFSTLTTNVNSVIINDSGVFAGTDRGVFFNNNRDSSWIAMNNGLTDSDIVSLTISGLEIFASTYSTGIFLSNNNGKSWMQVDSGLPNYSDYLSFLVSGSSIFAGGSDGVFLSTNNGGNWIQLDSGLTNTDVYSFAKNDAGLFVATAGGVFFSVNNGSYWTPANTGLTNTYVVSLAVSGTNLFAGTAGGGVFLSVNNGGNWTMVNTGITETYVNSIVSSGTNIFAGTYYSGVFLSSDNGGSWAPVNTGLTDIAVNAMGTSGTNIFAGTNSGMFLSTNSGSNWSKVNYGISGKINSIASNDSGIFAATTSGVFYSNNNGNNWTQLNNGLTDTIAFALAIEGDSIFVCTYYSGIFLSVNNGVSWQVLDTAITQTYPSALVASNHNILAGTGNGAFLSTDNGGNWSAIDNGLYNGFPFPPRVSAVAISGNELFAGTQGNGLYLSGLNSNYWQKAGLQNISINAITIANSRLFVGTFNNVWQQELPEIKTCSAQFSLFPDPNSAHHWFALEQATGVPPISYSWNWGDGSGADTGATPSHTYADSGYYTICLTITDSTGCTSTTCDSNAYLRSENQGLMVVVNVVTQLPTGTGITPVTDGTPSISIYPNPSSNQLIIEAANFHPQWISIYDMNGRKLTEQKFTQQLDVSALAAGLYFVEVKNEGVVVRSKFVKL